MYTISKEEFNRKLNELNKIISDKKKFTDKKKFLGETIKAQYPEFIDWLSGKPINFGTVDAPIYETISSDELIKQISNLMTATRRYFIPFIDKNCPNIVNLMKGGEIIVDDENFRLSYTDFKKFLITALATKEYKIITYLTEGLYTVFAKDYRDELSRNSKFATDMLYLFIESTRNPWHSSIPEYFQFSDSYELIPSLITRISQRRCYDSARSQGQIKELQNLYASHCTSNLLPEPDADLRMGVSFLVNSPSAPKRANSNSDHNSKKSRLDGDENFDAVGALLSLGIFNDKKQEGLQNVVNPDALVLPKL